MSKSKKQVGAFDWAALIMEDAVSRNQAALEDAKKFGPPEAVVRYSKKIKQGRLAAQLLRVAGREPLSVEKIIRIVGQAHALSGKSK